MREDAEFDLYRIAADKKGFDTMISNLASGHTELVIRCLVVTVEYQQQEIDRLEREIFKLRDGINEWIRSR